MVGKFQTIDHDYSSESEEVMDGDGAVVGLNFYKFKEEATFEYIATASSGGANSPTLTTVGATLTVTDTTADTNIAGTSWKVTKVSVKRSNTASQRVTVSLVKYPGITS
jgi:hypothetical protein